MNEVTSTMPIKGPENAILAPQGMDKAMRPAYIWKTGKTFFLSKKQQVVADTYLETRNFSECSRRLKEMGVKRSPLTCQRWLELDHVKAYMDEKFEERGVYAGWTKERWVLRMTRHLDGTDRLANGDLYAMKLMQGHMGWDVPQGGMSFNQQINITQANGKE